jgi:geranylgeranyl pyrophosphate synthase
MIAHTLTIMQLVDLVTRTGCLRTVRELCAGQVSAAQHALAGIPDSPAKAALTDLTSAIFTRVA